MYYILAYLDTTYIGVILLLSWPPRYMTLAAVPRTAASFSSGIATQSGIGYIGGMALSVEDLKQLAATGRLQAKLNDWAVSPAQFAVDLLPDHVQPPITHFHQQLYDLAQHPHPRKCVVCPRGHGKSTTITLVYILHSILFETQRFIVIVSDSLPQAKLFLEALADELRFNEELRFVFGDQTTEQWAQDCITTKSGIRVIAKGSGQKMRGLKYKAARPTLIVCDDIENDEHVLTPEQRSKLRRWFYAALLPSVAKDGQVFIVGTILHEDSLLNNVYEKDKTFLKRKFAAIEDGAPLWPERWSSEALEAEREHLVATGQADVWAQEFMCVAVNPETAEFKPNEFAYYDPAMVSSGGARTTISVNNVTYPLNVVIAVDPSMGRSNKADYSAIVVVGMSPDNKVYVLDVFRQRVSPDRLIDELFVRVVHWGPLKVCVEANGFQHLLARDMRDAQVRRNVHFIVEEYRSTTNKEARIRSLIPRVRNNSLVFPLRDKPVGQSNDLIAELASFPRAQHDDASDALEAALSKLVRPRSARRGPRREYTPMSRYGGY